MNAKTEAAFRREFGRRVKAARAAQGLSQRELAERAEVTDKYLSRIEVGAAMPSVFVADRIARALGVNLEALIGNTPRVPEISAPMRQALRSLRAMGSDELARAMRVLAAIEPRRGLSSSPAAPPPRRGRPSKRDAG